MRMITMSHLIKQAALEVLMLALIIYLHMLYLEDLNWAIKMIRFDLAI